MPSQGKRIHSAVQLSSAYVLCHILLLMYVHVCVFVRWHEGAPSGSREAHPIVFLIHLLLGVYLLLCSVCVRYGEYTMLIPFSFLRICET